MRTTLNDIAKAAGVSVSAVSKVLLGGGGKTTRVGLERANHIKTIAAHLNYRPNLVARCLSRQRNDMIGVIIDSQNDLLQIQLSFLERLAYTQNLLLHVGLVHNDINSIRTYARCFLDYGIKDVLVFAHSYPGFGKNVPELFSAFQNPVFIGRPMNKTKGSYVGLDFYESYRTAVKYLYSLGYRRIFWYRTKYEDMENRCRHEGFKKGCEECGMENNEFCYRSGKEFTDIENNYSSDWAAQFLDNVLPKNPDVLLVPNTMLATHCLHESAKRGLKVPENIGVFCTDLSLLDNLRQEDLSGMLQKHYNIVRQALKIIITNRNGKQQSRVAELIAPEIHAGSTCLNPQKENR